MAHYHSLLLVVLLLSLVSHGSADVAADRAECADKLIGMATCLPFARGEAKSPTPDCCTGYKQVTAKSIKCLCVLVKDRDDPSLGLHINVDKAITIPSKCDAPTNISTCTSILKLPPNSKEYTEFQQFENILEGKSSTVKMNSTESGGAMSAHSSHGSRERLMRIEMFPLLFLLLVVFGI